MRSTLDRLQYYFYYCRDSRLHATDIGRLAGAHFAPRIGANPKFLIGIDVRTVVAAFLNLTLIGVANLKAGEASSTAGDFIEGEDRTVREVAVEALGRLNGTVVVVDAGTGRILTVVNQKLALSSGYIPCSTIKLVAALAALNEGIVKPETKVWFKGGWYMTMTEALAISNNVYFAHLGRKLGFERVKRYANLFGFGEKAGWQIPGEQLGVFPSVEHKLGVGRMTTYGDGISVTPLQLAAFVSALANGGVLFYLQCPRTNEDIESFSPRVKRHLRIGRWIPGLEEGLFQAVKRGTAKNAFVTGQSIRGKTGTCTQYHRPGRTRLGWFAAYNNPQGKKLAVVVLLRGGSMTYGPRAAEVAGEVYQGLAGRNYFTADRSSTQVVSLGFGRCCTAQ